jgi:hypothetical protein
MLKSKEKLEIEMVARCGSNWQLLACVNFHESPHLVKLAVSKSRKINLSVKRRNELRRPAICASHEFSAGFFFFREPEREEITDDSDVMQFAKGRNCVFH